MRGSSAAPHFDLTLPVSWLVAPATPLVALTGTTVGIAALPFAVLAVWCAAGLAITLRVMTRRG